MYRLRFTVRHNKRPEVRDHGHCYLPLRRVKLLERRRGLTIALFEGHSHRGQSHTRNVLLHHTWGMSLTPERSTPLRGVRDYTSSLVRLLSASVLHVRDELLSSSLWRSDGAEMDGEVDETGCGGRVEKGESRRAGAGSMHELALSLELVLSAPILRVRDKPPGSSLLCSNRAGRDGEAIGVR